MLSNKKPLVKLARGLSRDDPAVWLEAFAPSHRPEAVNSIHI